MNFEIYTFINKNPNKTVNHMIIFNWDAKYMKKLNYFSFQTKFFDRC